MKFRFIYCIINYVKDRGCGMVDWSTSYLYIDIYKLFSKTMKKKIAEDLFFILSNLYVIV